jgi:hypothetical protein
MKCTATSGAQQRAAKGERVGKSRVASRRLRSPFPKRGKRGKRRPRSGLDNRATFVRTPFSREDHAVDEPARPRPSFSCPASQLTSTLLFSEATLSLLECAHCSQKINPTECRPKHVGEVELAGHALPQQKSRKPNFSAGANDEIRIRKVRGIKRAPNHFWRNQFDYLRK